MSDAPNTAAPPSPADAPMVSKPLVARQRREFQGFFIACGLAALLAGSIALWLAPPQHDVWAVWLQATLIPAAILVLIAANRDANRGLLALTVLLLWAESLLTASLYTIGVIFAIEIPLIGVGIVQPHLRGGATLAAYVGAGVVATVSVGLFAAGVPTNPVDEPWLAVVGFAFLAAFTLGLAWRAAERWAHALDQADREIDARTRAERSLAETTLLLRTLVSSSAVATMRVDADGRVSLWNPAAEQLFGVKADEAQGRPFFLDLRDEAEPAGPYSGINRAMKGQLVQGEHARMHRPDETDLVLEIHAAPHRDEDGHSLGAVVEMIDITERDRMEEVLRRAQRLEAVTHLAGGIAHDINNAMTTVGGYAALIAESASDAGTAENAREIAAAADQTSQTARDLLAFAGHSMLQPRVVDVLDYVNSLEPSLSRLVGTDIVLTVRHKIVSGRVRIDPVRFTDAVRNLVRRARDAMPSGGSIKLETFRVEDRAGDRPDSRRMIAIAVSDTGSPITREERAALFDPFRLLGLGDRTGLEMAVVYGLVRQSDGLIEVRSGANGSTIEIRLPEWLEAGTSP
jgi:PAS domain S-box-containing protein